MEGRLSRFRGVIALCTLAVLPFLGCSIGSNATNDPFVLLEGRWQSDPALSDSGTPDEINQYVVENGKQLRKNYDGNGTYQYTQEITNLLADSFTATITDDQRSSSEVGTVGTAKYSIQGDSMTQWWTTGNVADHKSVYSRLK